MSPLLYSLRSSFSSSPPMSDCLFSTGSQQHASHLSSVGTPSNRIVRLFPPHFLSSRILTLYCSTLLCFFLHHLFLPNLFDSFHPFSPAPFFLHPLCSAYLHHQKKKRISKLWKPFQGLRINIKRCTKSWAQFCRLCLLAERQRRVCVCPGGQLRRAD